MGKSWTGFGLTLAVLLGAAGFARGQEILTAPVGQTLSYPLDSGALDNPTDHARSVFRTVVRVREATWLRLYFRQVDLAPGSTLVITSLFDLKMQHHSAQSIEDWYKTSAYFNGDAVELELFAAAQSTGNRVVLDHVAYEMPLGIIAGSLCGLCNGDDRVPSQERWTGRMLPVGCTASMFNPAGCFVTAGHCSEFGAFLIEFQVPLSLPDGSLQHPGPEDQYPIDEDSIQFINGGVGRDWGYFTCNANSETGLRPIEAQGDYRPIATTLPDEFEVGLEIVGYGIALVGEYSQAQKRGVGPLLYEQSGFGSQEPAWFHRVDTTGGNSGSSILHNGEIIGIVTHCTGNCPNIGTLIDRPEFVAARASCPGRRGDCDADDDVDKFDITNLQACMTGPRFGPPAPGCECENYDGNTHVDLRDFSVLQNAQTGNLCTAAHFLREPQSEIVCGGQTMVLQAQATASHAVQYQWYKDGVPLDGQNGRELTIADFAEGDEADYTVYASALCGGVMSAPAEVRLCTTAIFEDTFETNLGWMVVSEPGMIRGQWFRRHADETLFNDYVDSPVQPGFDSPYDAGDKSFGTGPFGGAADSNDVDGGPTILYSPVLDLSGRQSLSLTYSYWFYRDNDDGDDALLVSVSNNGGQSWTQIARHEETTKEWRVNSIDIPTVITPTSQVQFRFFVEDAAGETLLEALVDDVRVSTAD